MLADAVEKAEGAEQYCEGVSSGYSEGSDLVNGFFGMRGGNGEILTSSLECWCPVREPNPSRRRKERLVNAFHWSYRGVEFEKNRPGSIARSVMLVSWEGIDGFYRFWLRLLRCFVVPSVTPKLGGMNSAVSADRSAGVSPSLFKTFSPVCCPCPAISTCLLLTNNPLMIRATPTRKGITPATHTRDRIAASLGGFWPLKMMPCIKT